MARTRTAAAIGYCEDCKKLTYLSRDDARKVGKRHQPHKNAYPCPFYDQFFHVGDLPLVIKQGHVTRDEFYGGEVA
jgi:hypothetical protein